MVEKTGSGIRKLIAYLQEHGENISDQTAQQVTKKIIEDQITNPQDVLAELKLNVNKSDES